MRADNALSHLYDGELCIAIMKDGSERKVRWEKAQWSFLYADDNLPTVCRFEDIEEWRPASITV